MPIKSHLIIYRSSKYYPGSKDLRIYNLKISSIGTGYDPSFGFEELRASKSNSNLKYVTKLSIPEPYYLFPPHSELLQFLPTLRNLSIECERKSDSGEYEESKAFRKFVYKAGRIKKLSLNVQSRAFPLRQVFDSFYLMRSIQDMKIKGLDFYQSGTRDILVRLLDSKMNQKICPKLKSQQISLETGYTYNGITNFKKLGNNLAEVINLLEQNENLDCRNIDLELALDSDVKVEDLGYLLNVLKDTQTITTFRYITRLDTASSDIIMAANRKNRLKNLELIYYADARATQEQTDRLSDVLQYLGSLAFWL